MRPCLAYLPVEVFPRCARLLVERIGSGKDRRRGDGDGNIPAAVVDHEIALVAAQQQGEDDERIDEDADPAALTPMETECVWELPVKFPMWVLLPVALGEDVEISTALSLDPEVPVSLAPSTLAHRRGRQGRGAVARREETGCW